MKKFLKFLLLLIVVGGALVIGSEFIPKGTFPQMYDNAKDKIVEVIGGDKVEPESDKKEEDAPSLDKDENKVESGLDVVD